MRRSAILMLIGILAVAPAATTTPVSAGQFGKILSAISSKPVELKLTAADRIDPQDFVDAAELALQEAGYKVERSNPRIGTIATDWRELSGRLQALTGTPQQTQIMMSLDAEGRTVKLLLSQRETTFEQRAVKVGRDQERDAKKVLDAVFERLKLTAVPEAKK